MFVVVWVEPWLTVWSYVSLLYNSYFLHSCKTPLHLEVRYSLWQLIFRSMDLYSSNIEGWPWVIDVCLPETYIESSEDYLYFMMETTATFTPPPVYYHAVFAACLLCLPDLLTALFKVRPSCCLSPSPAIWKTSLTLCWEPWLESQIRPDCTEPWVGQWSDSLVCLCSLWMLSVCVCEREIEPLHWWLILLPLLLSLLSVSLSHTGWWYSNVCRKAEEAEGVRVGMQGEWERRLVVISRATSRAGFMARSCWVADRRARGSSTAASQAAPTSSSSAYCCVGKRTAEPEHTTVSTLPLFLSQILCGILFLS